VFLLLVLLSMNLKCQDFCSFLDIHRPAESGDAELKQHDHSAWFKDQFRLGYQSDICDKIPMSLLWVTTTTFRFYLTSLFYWQLLQVRPDPLMVFYGESWCKMLTSRMPFLSSNQQCKSTERNIITLQFCWENLQKRQRRRHLANALITRSVVINYESRLTLTFHAGKPTYCSTVVAQSNVIIW